MQLIVSFLKPVGIAILTIPKTSNHIFHFYSIYKMVCNVIFQQPRIVQWAAGLDNMAAFTETCDADPQDTFPVGSPRLWACSPSAR
jgi:hypothetical protein